MTPTPSAYAYDEPSSPPTNNRLTNTTVGGGRETPYSYDAHGNMTAMPHLSAMAWDFKDQLQATQRQVVNNGPAPQTYYVYNAAGQRVRKVNQTATGAKLDERIYLGGFEIYSEFDATTGAITLEQDILHVADDKRRIALVETTTIDQSAPANSLPSTVIRYQFDNHLGSACLELSENAAVISYEEYYPYGNTSYQADSAVAEVSLKRYRYTGKERDEENGFYSHGARYYAPWLGRWTACDPKGAVDGPNLFAYARNNPIMLKDPGGAQAESTDSGTDQLHQIDTRTSEQRFKDDVIGRAFPVPNLQMQSQDSPQTQSPTSVDLSTPGKTSVDLSTSGKTNADLSRIGETILSRRGWDYQPAVLDQPTSDDTKAEACLSG